MDKLIKNKVDRGWMENIALRLESIEISIKELKENLINTHELLNEISNRMVNR